MEWKEKELRKLGGLIKARRKAQGVSQKSFAFEANLDQRWLREIESGKANPSLSMIMDIAHALHTSVGELWQAANGSFFGRLPALVGLWKGKIHQDPFRGGNPEVPYRDLPYRVEMACNLEDGKFSGHFAIYVRESRFAVEQSTMFSIKKVVERENGIFHFEYNSQDPLRVQYGIVLARLSNIPDTLKGAFVSFGARSDAIVRGTIVLSKNS